jgi:PAS domain-containing protein
MSTASEFLEFTDSLHERRVELLRAAPAALRAIGRSADSDMMPHVLETVRLIDSAVADLESAEDELRAQNDALVEARFEVEESAALFRDLFELAPIGYLVTDTLGTIRQINATACLLLRRPKNAVVGKPLACYVDLDERSGFRTAFDRSRHSLDVEEWSVRLTPRNAPPIDCRVCVRVLREPSGVVRALAWTFAETPSDPLDL